MNLWTHYNLDPNTGDPPMAMDYRHVEMLRDSLIAESPRIAVEIGSYRGHSTVAFLAAMEVLPEMQLHIFDTHLTHELLDVLDMSGIGGRIFPHQEPAWDCTIEPDYVFIDGDHGVPALADLAWCLTRNVSVIAMHDTRTASRLPHCDGAYTAANLLRGMNTRTWVEDHEDRPGENTWRGFGISKINRK